MACRVRAAALWCAVALCCAALVVVPTTAYTVDCNPEYTDCDAELGKAISEDDETLGRHEHIIESTPHNILTTTIITPTRSTVPVTNTGSTSTETTTDATESNVATETNMKPKPRLLNLNVEDLQNFANVLHNQTHSKESKIGESDLSNVNLEEEIDDEEPTIATGDTKHMIQDKFYSNLQEPFHPLFNIERSDEIETCIENGMRYKVGDKVERGCEESCECTPNGQFECSPRCKSPFIRRGRRLNDPLCFESPVDDCCSIVACATGNGDPKPTVAEVCKYNNMTYTVGSKWNIGCEQTCTCERNSVVTCKPRCNRLPQSDKCINVQDPNDECCEVQVCDVSQDVHEEVENITSTTEMSIERHDEMMSPQKSTMRPLVLTEPIGSIKVLHNNSVQVNLIHVNKTNDPIHLQISNDNGKNYKDIDLKYSNLILKLEGGRDYILRTKETGTKFNFTITANDNDNEALTTNVMNKTKYGCYHNEKYYEVGEEFQIGCAEVCECTGQDTRECAPLVCPSHVGLELVSKSCVQWAPNPPPHPPNCCPRSARCLSDGTCHYKGIPIPNWSKVPIELTGCEEHCFCENGELDCQEVCSPLSPIPPQTLRCPPLHRPAPVNISDEDCCKEWGCLALAGTNGSTVNAYSVQSYATPISSILPIDHKLVLPIPHTPTEAINFHRHMSSAKFNIPKHFKPHGSFHSNISFASRNVEPGLNLINKYFTDFGNRINKTKTMENMLNPLLKLAVNSNSNSKPNKVTNQIPVDTIGITDNADSNIKAFNSFKEQDSFKNRASMKKVPMSKLDDLKFFLPVYDKKTSIHTQNVNKHIDKNTDLQNKSYSQKNLNNDNLLHNTNLSQDKNPFELNKLRNDKNSNLQSHLLTKHINPYETVLLRPVSSGINIGKTMLLPFMDPKERLPKINPPKKSYSTLDLEQILSQMEIETEVASNMERSTNKTNRNAADPSKSVYPVTPHSQIPPFLPTVPPDNNNYPQEDIQDYDLNNIHRPDHPNEPAMAGLPPGIPIPSYGDDNKRLSVLSLQGDSPTSIKMLFGLPSVLVGLRGSIDLRYTDTEDKEISHWYSQVFAPADEVLTTARLEFRLTGLKPSTTYKIRGKLYLHNLPVEPESEILTVRTQDLATVIPLEEKRREIDCKLTVVDVNDTTAHVTWKHFSEDELPLIDGIQVRYRSMGSPIYSMTELFHHSRSEADLHDLRPGSQYEASLVLMPPPRATTELYDSRSVEFTTAPYIDPFNWTVVVEARVVGSEAVELTWRGVPVPAERWVRVYRAAHDCGDNRKEHDSFRMASRDPQTSITLTGLEPDTKCRVWLDLFLTNGKVKTSNILEVHTRTLDSSESIDNVIESSSIARMPARGDYYGALVVVGVVAALAALAAVLLLLVVVRRHRPRSVAITSVPSAPRESSLPPYDNPAYKLEIQQETMDL